MLERVRQSRFVPFVIGIYIAYVGYELVSGVDVFPNMNEWFVHVGMGIVIIIWIISGIKK